MRQTEDNSAPTVSYLLEHSHGTCELWIKRSEERDFTTFVPLRLQRISGQGALPVETETIFDAILLEEWMADHFEVFKDGRTSFE